MKYELYTDAKGEWRWRLLAANSRNIANSGEGYHNKSDAVSAINLVKSSAGAPIVEK